MFYPLFIRNFATDEEVCVCMCVCLCVCVCASARVCVSVKMTKKMRGEQIVSARGFCCSYVVGEALRASKHWRQSKQRVWCESCFFFPFSFWGATRSARKGELSCCDTWCLCVFPPNGETLRHISNNEKREKKEKKGCPCFCAVQSATPLVLESWKRRKGNARKEKKKAQMLSYSCCSESVFPCRGSYVRLFPVFRFCLFSLIHCSVKSEKRKRAFGGICASLLCCEAPMV